MITYLKGTNYGAQSFTTDEVYAQIDYVQAYVRANVGHAAGNVTAEIYASSGDFPTGGALATGSTNVNSLVDGVDSWMTFVLDSPLVVAANTKYVLVLKFENETADKFIWYAWGDAEDILYTGGEASFTLSGDWTMMSSFFPANYYDRYFITYGSGAQTTTSTTTTSSSTTTTSSSTTTTSSSTTTTTSSSTSTTTTSSSTTTTSSSTTTTTTTTTQTTSTSTTTTSSSTTTTTTTTTLPSNVERAKKQNLYREGKKSNFPLRGKKVA